MLGDSWAVNVGNENGRGEDDTIASLERRRCKE
jgi:hypothetical protein